jgi:hypothetical protein
MLPEVSTNSNSFILHLDLKSSKAKEQSHIEKLIGQIPASSSDGQILSNRKFISLEFPDTYSITKEKFFREEDREDLPTLTQLVSDPTLDISLKPLRKTERVKRKTNKLASEKIPRKTKKDSTHKGKEFHPSVERRNKKHASPSTQLHEDIKRKPSNKSQSKRKTITISHASSQHLLILDEREVKHPTSSNIQLPIEKKKIVNKEDVIQKVNACYSDYQPILHDEIPQIMDLIIQSAYDLLHDLCQKQFTEEGIEFLSDYFNWVRNGEKNNKIIKNLIKTYIGDIKSNKIIFIKSKNKPPKTIKINKKLKKRINIPASLSTPVITAFKEKDFDTVKQYLKSISKDIAISLWFNVFYDALENEVTREKVLNSLCST